MSNTGQNKDVDTSAALISALLKNPAAAVILVLLLGGQGVEVVSGQNYTAELRELRHDVTTALQEITDNSERISRLENRVDRVMDDQSEISDALEELIEEIEALKHE